MSKKSSRLCANDYTWFTLSIGIPEVGDLRLALRKRSTFFRGGTFQFKVLKSCLKWQKWNLWSKRQTFKKK